MRKQMKMKFMLLLISTIMVISMMPNFTSVIYAEEEGASSNIPKKVGDYYYIGTADELLWFATYVNGEKDDSKTPNANPKACAKLIADVDLTGREWVPIGRKVSYSIKGSYEGIFDGQNHSITLDKLKMSSNYSERYGLFNTVSGTIKNVTVMGTVDTGEFGKGNVGAIAGKAEIGSYFINCHNKANVSGTMTVGGIVGAGSAFISKSSNSGEISTTKNYNVGGIIGSAEKQSIISECYNEGKVISKKTHAGGILGYSYKAEEIINCYNTGEIISTDGQSGGLIGIPSYGAALKVTNCYNVGSVTGSKDIGGIVSKEVAEGNAYTNIYYLDLIEDYAAVKKGALGDVVPAKVLKEVMVSDETLSSLGNLYAVDEENKNSGYPILKWQNESQKLNFKNLMGDFSISGDVCDGSVITAVYTKVEGEPEVSYQWYRVGAGEKTKINDATKLNYTVSDMDILSALMVEISADGYEKVSLTTAVVPNFVGFSVTPEKASVEVINGDKTYNHVKDMVGIYSLPEGTYTYTVSAEGEYSNETGSFIVPYSENGGTINVNLAVKEYEVTFNLVPENTKLTVKDEGDIISPVAGNMYSLPKGDYTYSVTAFGYESKNDIAFTVTGENTANVTLDKLETQSLKFNVTKEEGGSDKSIHTLVKQGNIVVDMEDDGSYLLPRGNYEYIISCGGYKSASGTFVIAQESVTIDVQLKISYAWDGITYTEPVKGKDDVYLISNVAELMWFGKNAEMKDCAKLLSDIIINDDINGDEDSLYNWKPIGYYHRSSDKKPYIGTFDGNNFTIYGLYINGTHAKNAALFGLVGEEGTVKNLTVYGSVKNKLSRNNYSAAFASTNYGNIENCHNYAKVSGCSYVGGVVGTGDKGTIKNCSNHGEIIAEKDNVGGIVGYCYSTDSSAVSGCHNAGKVEGTKNVAGIVGKHYKGGTIIDVYNTGEIVGNEGVGGLIGDLRLGTLKNAYNIGIVTAKTAGEAGNIIGSLSWGDTKVINNVYSLDSLGTNYIGSYNEQTVDGEVTLITSDDLKNEYVKLGEAFISDVIPNINNGYPMLLWQVSDNEEPEQPDKPVSDPNGWDGNKMLEPNRVEAVYQIGTAEELAWFSDNVKRNGNLDAKLINNIDLNNRQWIIIGGTDDATSYSGTFDGCGFEIQNLYLEAKKNGAGLFGMVSGTVKNVVVSGKIVGKDYVAGIVAYNAGTVENCINKVAVIGGNYVAGIVSHNKVNSKVLRCDNSGMINASMYAGGVVGYNVDTAMIKDCANNGFVSVETSYAAGVCGRNEGEVENCYNKGNVLAKGHTQKSYTGGVLGYSSGQVENLYNMGTVVSKGSFVGGAIGIVTVKNTAQNIYGAGEVCGAYIKTNEPCDTFYVGGAVGRTIDSVKNAYYLDSLKVSNGGVAKTEVELKDVVFLSTLGEGFVQDKDIINNGFPILKWQNTSNKLEDLQAISGSIEIVGNIEAEQIVSATYTGTLDSLIYVWYVDTEKGENVLEVSDDNKFKLPTDIAGKKIHLRVISPLYAGTIETVSNNAVEGMSGTVTIEGYPVIGRTLKAEYSNVNQEPKYQWYRGNSMIDGATNASYIIENEDVGSIMKVRVTGNKAGYVEKALDNIALNRERANVWQPNECLEPTQIDDVYQITNEKELHWFASEINSGKNDINAILVNDVKLTLDKWYPIGRNEVTYVGDFNGNGNRISNLNYSIEGTKEEGLFAVVGKKATVDNLIVQANIHVIGNGNIPVGGIAGLVKGRITNCVFEGEVSANIQVGGIAGLIDKKARIENCINKGTVTGNAKVGGIVGNSAYGETYYCINNGNVTANDELAGGIVGEAVNYAKIWACYNTGSIDAPKYVGGISGKVYVAAAPQGCYNVGLVTTKAIFNGGVIGNIDGTDYISMVKGSYYLNTLPKDSSAKAISDEVMKSSKFVTALNSQAFDDVYKKSVDGMNDGYPILKWEVGENNEHSGGNTPEKPEKDDITVYFTLIGDDVHGNQPHVDKDHTWIKKMSFNNLSAGTTAYKVFKKALKEKDYTYEVEGNSYIKSITNSDGIKLEEFDNGPRSGWMYTINGKFPDYMATVKVHDKDNMIFFYVDDYKETGWDPDGDSDTHSKSDSSSKVNDKKNVKSIVEVGYQMPANINPNCIVFYHVDKNGNRKLIKECVYDAKTKKMKVPSDYLDRYEIEYSEVVFNDIEDTWAKDKISFLAARNIVKGKTKNCFDPNSTITRAEFAQVLANMSGVDLNKYNHKTCFTDVSTDVWYSKATAWAKDIGIISGSNYGDDTIQFNPNENISRQDMAVMISRYVKKVDENKLQEIEEKMNFEDENEIADYAKEAVEILQKAGIIHGVKDKDGHYSFSPKTEATRAEMASMIEEFIVKCLLN